MNYFIYCLREMNNNIWFIFININLIVYNKIDYLSNVKEKKMLRKKQNEIL